MVEFITFLIMVLFIIIGLGYLFYCFMQHDKNNLITRTSANFSIIIPARDESLVIEDLLISITNQTVKINPQDVYIVVEKKEDKTCEIAKKYNMNIVIRRDLNLKRKGYAIDDAIKYIKSHKKHYDLYFIFDADNVLDKSFIEKLLKNYREGYDIAVGYRNTKNGNDSVVSAASSLTFTMINTLFNKFKLKRNLNVTISGTGFYISGEIIDNLGGYPFNMLTEDYELSVYSSLNNFTSTYNEEAIFYDEQPVKYSVTKRQRTRWIRGYIDTRKKYGQALKIKSKEKNNPKIGSIRVERVGIKPYLFMVIGIAFYVITNTILIFVNIILANAFIYNVLNVFGLILLVYLVLVLITLLMLKCEKEYFLLSKKTKLKAVFYNPVFLASYVPIAINALFNSDIEWSKIEHNKKM